MENNVYEIVAFTEIGAIEKQWLALDSEAARRVADGRLRQIDYGFYQTYDWNHFVAKYYAETSKRKHIEYLTVLRNGETVAILPLLISKFPSKKVEFTSWKTAGVNNVSSPYQSEADRGIYTTLAEGMVKKFHGMKFKFRDMPGDCPFALAMSKATGKQLTSRESYHIPLGDFEDFDAFYGSLSKKLRHNIQTRSNHFTHGDLKWELKEYTAANPPSNGVLEAVWRLFYYRKLQWKGKSANIFQKIACKYKVRRELLTGMRTKSLSALPEARLYVFEINGEPAAFTLYYQRGEHILVPKLAIDMRFRTHAPGILMLKEILRRCYEQGIKDFDLCRGEEPYKQQMGAVCQPLSLLKG